MKVFRQWNVLNERSEMIERFERLALIPDAVAEAKRSAQICVNQRPISLADVGWAPATKQAKCQTIDDT
jgi:hypothetical protein